MALPFVRWSGGKRRLLDQLRVRLPSDIEKRRYVEPFLGGGALFFGLEPKRALLNDLNEDLMNAYGCLQTNDIAVLDLLWPMLREHDATLYAFVRDLFNARSDEADNVLRAAWFLYLMSTNFNGLYRVNAAGEFNTPVGDKVLFNEQRVNNAVRVLRGGALTQRECQIELRSVDFDKLEYEPDDFVYLDSPYASDTDGFVSYTSGGFDNASQWRLRDRCLVLNARGILWMQSNANIPWLRDMYQGFRIEEISAPRTMAANGDRTPASEVIIRNY